MSGRDAEKDIAVCEAASPGPWEVETEYMTDPGYEQYIKRQEIVRREDDGTIYIIAQINWSCPVVANAQLMSMVRDALPHWIRRAVEYKKQLQKAHEEIRELKEQLRPGSLTERYPTVDAYEKTCAALEKHRSRADEAEAQLTAAREQLEQAKREAIASTGAEYAARLRKLEAVAKAAKRYIQETGINFESEAQYELSKALGALEVQP